MRTWILILAVMACSFAKAQSKELIVPKTYVALKADKELTIDGKALEKDWEKAAWSDEFIDIEGKKIPKYSTRVKMLWDDSYFYILADMKEPHVWANLKQRDTVVFYNNDFEVFVDPDGDTHNYYELELNALNTAWDLFLTQPYRGSNAVVNDYEMIGLKSAIHVDGTLNDFSDQDEGWTVEIAIPWSTFKLGYNQDVVPVDQFWRVDFSRVNWEFDIIDQAYVRKKDANGKYLPEYNWVWSPTGVINMHEPEKWAYVFFSSKDPGDDSEFEIPKDEKIKWELYALYRSHLKYMETNNAPAGNVSSLTNKSIEVEGQPLEVVLKSHDVGWNLSVKSPFSGKTLIVKEDGKFLSQ
jgi:hypothetical protein